MAMRLTKRRGALLLAAAGLLAAVLVITAQSSASNIYACVKKSGAARISKTKPKCRKGEKKLTWSTRGPAGTTGANGASGSAGAEGAAGKKGATAAVAGFGAMQSSNLNLKGQTTLAPVPGLSKELPAGSFIVSANLEIDAKLKASASAAVLCELIDTPAAGSPESQTGRWQQADTSLSLSTELAGEISLHLAVSLPSSTSTVSLQCKETAESNVEALAAVSGALVAVQTTSNK
jgi:hypothetical protein